MFQKKIIQFEDHFNDICFFVSNDLVLKYLKMFFKIFQMIKIILYVGCTVLTLNYFTVHKGKALRIKFCTRHLSG